MKKALFALGVLLCLLPWIPGEVSRWAAPICLLYGTALALSVGNPFESLSKKVSKPLLQGAVVLLGFSLDINKVIDAGEKGIVFALCSISLVFLAGYFLGRLLKLNSKSGLLVTVGTAICGGSAIAAVSAVTDADHDEISIAVATVFLLNAVALFIFPPLGHMLSLSPEKFGTWAGIAIHDVASVVGAANVYGPGAYTTAVAVKLSRVLYLFPITLIIAAMYRKNKPEGQKSAPFPWFILLFVAASVIRSAIPAAKDIEPIVKQVAATGFCLSLFLIGSLVKRETLKKTGARPLIHGVALWLLISVLGLAAVRGIA